MVYIFLCCVCSKTGSRDAEEIGWVPEEHKPIANTVLESFMHYLWYLCEHLIGFACFSDGVSVECKVQMVAALSRNGDDHPDKQLQESDISSKQLSDFVTINTRDTFVALDFSQEFLPSDPSLWKSCDNDNTGQARIMALKVVNDAAEYGILLIKAINQYL